MTATPQEVRSFYRSNPDRLSALSPEAQATVGPQTENKSQRGRIHPEARADFNTDHKGKAAYVEGEAHPKTVAVKAVKFTKTAVRRPVVEIPTAEAREQLALLGFEVGQRGRFAAAQLEALGVATVI